MPAARKLLAVASLVALAALPAALSYRHWASGFAQQDRQVEVRLRADPGTVFFGRWEDPRIDPDAVACATNGGSGVESLTIQRSKRGWCQLAFEPASQVPFDVESVRSAAGDFTRVRQNAFVFPPERWTVRRSAAAAALLTFVGCLFAISGAWWLWVGAAVTPRFKAAYVVILSAFLALFWTAVFFPALMSEDSLDQWGQALSGKYTTWHPPVMAMLMHATQAVTDSPSLFAFLQAWLFWGSIFAVLAVLLPSRPWLVASLVLVVLPPLWPYSVTIWKDVWVASFLLLAAAALIAFWRHPRLALCIAAAAAVAVCVAFRANAIFLAIVPPVVLWLRRSSMRRPALSAAGLLALMLAPALVINRLPSVTAVPSSYMYVLPQYIGTVSLMQTSGVPIEDEVRAFDARFGAGRLEAALALPHEDWDCTFYLVPLLTEDRLIRERRFLAMAAAKESLRHPLCAVRHKAAFLARLVQLPRVHYAFHAGIRRNPYGLGEHTLLPGVRSTVLRLLRATEHGILFRHAIWILGLFVMLLARKKNASGLKMLACLGLIYAASFVPVEATPDWRYLLPSTLCAWVGLASIAAESLGSKT